MSKSLFLLLVLVTIFNTGSAQVLNNESMTIPEQEKKPAELLGELLRARNDSNKVKILISLGSSHWHNDRRRDSAIYYAGEARKLSKSIGFMPGFYQASYILCRSYLSMFMVMNAIDLLPGLPKDQRARYMIAIGERYLFMPGDEKKNMDSAFLWLSKASEIVRTIGSEKMKHNSLVSLGKYYILNGQYRKGKDCFLEIIKDQQVSGNKAAEAFYWSEFAKYMPSTDSTMRDELWAQGNALTIYQLLKDTAKIASQLMRIAGFYSARSNFDMAKSIYSKAIQLHKAAQINNNYQIYISLAWMGYDLGNFDEALAWTLEAEKNKKLLEVSDKDDVLILQGLIHAENGQAEKSLKYLLEITPLNYRYNYFIYNKIAEQYLSLNNPVKALSFIREEEKKHPPVSRQDKEIISSIKGEIFNALDNPELAEKYFLQMIDLDKEAQKIRSREILPNRFNVSGPQAYYKIAKFYESRGKYRLAEQYADSALHINSFSGYRHQTSNLSRIIYQLKFKIDSASGDYISAIRNYEKYTALNDSIFNAAKNNRMLQLEIHNETEKKETEIKARDQRIKTLKQNDLLREANIKQANLIRNIIIAIILILLITGAVFYKQYRHKQKITRITGAINKIIDQKNMDIMLKNEVLEELVVEKEWLLKEMHHRVKNNLHTVICLLESQATFLGNDARLANEISQQRIYVMSLVHQKLYQSEDIKTIDMAGYLPEFIQHLDNSFSNNKNIHFDLGIERLMLDISQAIPVALIINEAVTNSIKYAFPGRTTELSISAFEDQATR